LAGDQRRENAKSSGQAPADHPEAQLPQSRPALAKGDDEMPSYPGHKWHSFRRQIQFSIDDSGCVLLIIYDKRFRTKCNTTEGQVKIYKVTGLN
jgi:hypothetical protein